MFSREGLATARQEEVSASLALLLGPETDYRLRMRAARRLARRGPAILPYLLTILNAHPEITVPAWPSWPAQYEQCGRLLMQLTQQAHLRLEALFHHPAITSPYGPVLWTSIAEAAGLMPLEDHEALLCQGLAVPWSTTRYAAAMALTMRARRVPLRPATLDALRAHQHSDETLPVRLTTSYALLNCRDPAGLHTLIQFLESNPLLPEEVRKAVLFILETELPFPLSSSQRDYLAAHLLRLLSDSNTDIVIQASRALSKIAWPALLPSLIRMLNEGDGQDRIAALTTLEAIARQKHMRRAIHQQAMPVHILPLLKSHDREVRRQAGYTLAACGDGYAASALGTILLHQEHPAHLEAIESLRLLHGVLRPATRTNTTHWLLWLLNSSSASVQIMAIDSLTSLLWQARTRRRFRAYSDIGWQIFYDATIVRLLHHPDGHIRQRVVGLFSLLDEQLALFPPLYQSLLHLLHHDNDSSVRAAVAYACGQLGIRLALPDLLHALNDENEHVALTALHTLKRIATPHDLCVLHALEELIYLYNKGTCVSQALVAEAAKLLKKWKKVLSRSPTHRQLHGHG
ncbi:MAG: HEAT repeat domain-containing protein [Ktedonobacteraceae bacterium]|nr:HEAT repeat domain-containing protein [Ktedonobacteraceae bacterium]